MQEEEMIVGESYVELMWRVIKDAVWEGQTVPQLKGAFLDLTDAEAYAKKIGGTVIVLKHEVVKTDGHLPDGPRPCG